MATPQSPSSTMSTTSRRREDGWRATDRPWTRPAWSFRPEYVVRETSNAVGGLRAARRLLSLPDRPSAIFCFSDRMAMGVYHAAHERGLRIPGDVSVIGFDNQIAVGDGLFPGLTTIALPHYEMGAWGARTLIHQLEDPQEGGVEHVALACPLIARGSISEPCRASRGPCDCSVLATNRTVRTGEDPSQVNFGARAPGIQGHYRSRGRRTWSGSGPHRQRPADPTPWAAPVQMPRS